jgi:predicted glycosyltransferase involved in capsule biosynthesis
MLSVIVPYRDRAEHLALFKPAVYNYLKDNLDCEFRILLIEQAGNDPFNRAKLLNVGALHCGGYTSYLCFHDVDHIPINVDYNYNTLRNNAPIQLVKSTIQPTGYLGGVTLFDSIFYELGGFSNNFWGWGGEDNEMHHHLIKNGVRQINRFGEWNILGHEKAGTFDKQKWNQSLLQRGKYDGIHHCRYNRISTVLEPEFNLLHLLVEI